jgi:hypothetical protein
MKRCAAKKSLDDTGFREALISEPSSGEKGRRNQIWPKKTLRNDIRRSEVYVNEILWNFTNQNGSR